MKPIWTSRVTEVAVRYGEHAPMAATCCNACRTCVQTNAIAGALAGVLALAAGSRRLFRRVAGRPVSDSSRTPRA